MSNLKYIAYQLDDIKVLELYAIVFLSLFALAIGLMSQVPFLLPFANGIMALYGTLAVGCLIHSWASFIKGMFKKRGK